MTLRSTFNRCWRVAELKTGMQIAAGRTPRWHRALVRVELAIRSILRRKP